MPEGKTVQPSKALYYPHVEFRSTAWVKSALLYWEGLIRYRPPGSSPKDDPQIQKLIAAGLIEEMEFVRLRRQLTPEIGPPLEKLMRAHGNRLPPCIPRMDPVRGLTLEYEETVRQQLIEDLHGYPLAQKAFAVGLDQVRPIFFTFLIDKVASARGLASVTDEPIFDAIATYFGEQGITDDAKNLTENEGSTIAELSLPTPSLEALSELPVERLLEIRQKYAAQRHHFRDSVQAQVAQIAKLPTREAIEERLKAFRKEIEDDLQAAREAVKHSKAKERWTLLGISAPASLAAGVSIATVASPVVGPVGGVGTLALGMTSWFMRKHSGEPPGSHYLLSLDSAVKDPWQRLSRAFRDLV
jgi:hypothetical protein